MIENHQAHISVAFLINDVVVVAMMMMMLARYLLRPSG